MSNDTYKLGYAKGYLHIRVCQMIPTNWIGQEIPTYKDMSSDISL